MEIVKTLPTPGATATVTARLAPGAIADFAAVFGQAVGLEAPIPTPILPEVEASKGDVPTESTDKTPDGKAEAGANEAPEMVAIDSPVEGVLTSSKTVLPLAGTTTEAGVNDAPGVSPESRLDVAKDVTIVPGTAAIPSHSATVFAASAPPKQPLPVVKDEWTVVPKQVSGGHGAGATVPSPEGIVTTTQPPQQAQSLRAQVGQPIRPEAEAGTGEEPFEPLPASRLEAAGSVMSTSHRPEAAPVRADLARQVSAQITDAARSAPKGEIEVVLRPEELGTVRLRLSPTEQGMIVHLAAERGETLELIRRNLDGLLQDFRGLGFTTAGFSFGGSSARGQDPRAPSGKFDGTVSAQPSPEPVTAARSEMALSGRLDMRL